MKFNCGLTLDEKLALDKKRRAIKEENQRSWHTSFALFPKRVEPRKCVWLELVERRRITICNPEYSPHYLSQHRERYIDVWEYREYVEVTPPVPV